MEYIYSILNGENTYSVFSRKKVINGKISELYGLCIENIAETVIAPDITMIKEIALYMIKVISYDKIPPDHLYDIINRLV